MGLFDFLFGSRPKAPAADGYYKSLTAYQPVFTSWGGKLYENELVRASIDALARHSAKLQPTIVGTASPKLRARIRSAPNPFMTWYQFLYRLRTILEVQNTAFIVPVYDAAGTEIEGFFPVLPSQSQIVEVDGEPVLKYTFLAGMTAYLPMDECGVLTRHQYKDDFFGEPNTAISGTMQLTAMQQQGIEEGIKNSATFRFMARVTNFTKPSDLSKERQRFNAENLRGESGGVLLFPNTYDSIQQIRQDPYTVDAAQMQLIRTNVFNFFGVSEDVLQNKAVGDSWSAFYEGAIEPFAIQLSEVLTAMTFTGREQATGNRFFFTSNRLQYMTNSDKLRVSAHLVDRGVMSRNEAREIWNLPPIEGGDDYVIRGEYKSTDSVEDPDREGTDDAV